MKDIEMRDTITIPKEWVPTIVRVLDYLTSGDVPDDYTDDERRLVADALAIERGLAMRMKEVPLVALPRVKP